MRSFAFLALATLSSVVTAQTTLTTLTGGTNQGNVGNMIWFDLQVNQTLTISQLTMLCGANTVASATANVDVYLGPSTYIGNTLNTGLWTVAATTGPVMAVAPSTQATATLAVPLCLGPGSYGVGLRSSGFNHGYTNGLTCTSTTVPGSCSNSLFSTPELTFRGGANQNTPFTSALNTPRIWNGSITYTLGGVPSAIASWQKYGSGCYGWFHSFMENYPNPSTSYDLKSATTGLYNSLRMTFAGTGYIVSAFNNGTGTFYTPTAAATNLNLLNASTATVTLPWFLPYPMPTGPQTTNTLQVFDNGYISPQTAPAPVQGSPTAALFLGGVPRWCNWFDFDPSLNTATGSVSFENDPNGLASYVTWLNVPDVAIATSSNTFQFAFFANGDVEIRFGAMSLAQGGTYPALVGWTPGGGVMNPGDIDISAIATPFTTGPTDNPPLDLALTIRPQLGSNPGFVTSNIPAGTVFGVLLLGFVQVSPGVDLGFLGAPGCYQNLDLNSAINNLFFVAGSSTTFNFGIPNLPAFNGVNLAAQSATFTSGYNALGVLMSNGARLTVGTL
jgi:hypothetical protein